MIAPSETASPVGGFIGRADVHAPGTRRHEMPEVVPDENARRLSAEIKVRPTLIEPGFTVARFRWGT